LVPVGIIVTACGSDGGNVGPPAAQLAFTVQPAGTIAGQTISPPIQVSIEDASGNVVTSAQNEITLALDPISSAAKLSGTTTATASGGVATFADLQISKAGTGYTLSASATGLASVSSTTFGITAAPGVATTIAGAAEQSQSGTVGQPVGIPPAVLVTDGLGNPVPNIPVTFEVVGGGGTLSEGEQTTGADGVARLGQWTLGTVAGSNGVLATAPGLEGSPVSFAAQAVAGPAAKLTVQGGDGQTTVAGTAVEEPPSVLVTDVYGNAVKDVAVSFRVKSGGGVLTGALPTTAEDGFAAPEGWTLGKRPGLNTLTATASDLTGSPVTFSATAATGAIVEARNNYFRSLQNGSGSPIVGNDIFGKAAVDTIMRGETVTWVWTGQGHNVALGSAGSETHNAPHTFSITFDTPNSYAYRCTNHSFIDLYFLDLAGMRGTIVVR
jgi:plastocyanin